MWILSSPFFLHPPMCFGYWCDVNVIDSENLRSRQKKGEERSIFIYNKIEYIRSSQGPHSPHFRTPGCTMGVQYHSVLWEKTLMIAPISPMYIRRSFYEPIIPFLLDFLGFRRDFTLLMVAHGSCYTSAFRSPLDSHRLTDHVCQPAIAAWLTQLYGDLNRSCTFLKCFILRYWKPSFLRIPPRISQNVLCMHLYAPVRAWAW